MNKAGVTAMGAMNIKMVEEVANEISTWMLSFLQIHVFVDMQLSLVVPVLARHVNFQDNIC